MNTYWGFKTDAHWIATGVRADLGLSLTDPLDVQALADHLAVPVEPLSEMVGVQAAFARQLGVIDVGSFSAVTVMRGTARKIIYNDAHSPGRCNSNIAHELSHALLQHPPTPPLDDRGCRIWNEEVEDQANWLAGVMLVTDEAAVTCVRRGITLRSAALHYGVSEPMMRFRINMSGARKRVERARALRGSQSA